MTLVLTWINVRGIKQSSWVVNALTIGKLLPLAVFIIGGIWFIDPSHFANMPAVSREQVSAAAILLIFAYGGYEVTGVLAGEAANPRKDVPFAFVAVLIIVSIVMSLTSLVATGVLPDVGRHAHAARRWRGDLPRRRRRGDDLDRLGRVDDRQQHGPAAEWLAHDLRAGRERRSAALVRQGASATTARRRTRSCSAPASRLILALSGSFVALAAVSAIARLVMYLAVCMSTLVLRKRDREIAAQVGAHFTDPLQAVAPPKFTVPFGPVIPILASIVALGILAGATRPQLTSGVAALAAGAVLYFLAPRQERRRRAVASDSSRMCARRSVCSDATSGSFRNRTSGVIVSSVSRSCL